MVKGSLLNCCLFAIATVLLLLHLAVAQPTNNPTPSTSKPTTKPTANPTNPTSKPTTKPTANPTAPTTTKPTLNPTLKPVTGTPTTAKPVTSSPTTARPTTKAPTVDPNGPVGNFVPPTTTTWTITTRTRVVASQKLKFPVSVAASQSLTLANNIDVDLTDLGTQPAAAIACASLTTGTLTIDNANVIGIISAAISCPSVSITGPNAVIAASPSAQVCVVGGNDCQAGSVGIQGSGVSVSLRQATFRNLLRSISASTTNLFITGSTFENDASATSPAGLIELLPGSKSILIQYSSFKNQSFNSIVVHPTVSNMTVQNCDFSTVRYAIATATAAQIVNQSAITSSIDEIRILDSTFTNAAIDFSRVMSLTIENNTFTGNLGFIRCDRCSKVVVANNKFEMPLCSAISLISSDPLFPPTLFNNVGDENFPQTFVAFTSSPLCVMRSTTYAPAAFGAVVVWMLIAFVVFCFMPCMFMRLFKNSSVGLGASSATGEPPAKGTFLRGGKEYFAEDDTVHTTPMEASSPPQSPRNDGARNNVEEKDETSSTVSSPVQTIRNTAPAATVAATTSGGGPPKSIKEIPKVSGVPLKVKFNYQARSKDEMSITKGTVVRGIELVQGDGWWLGESPDGRRGLFPANYVKPADPETLPAPPAATKPGAPTAASSATMGAAAGGVAGSSRNLAGAAPGASTRNIGGATGAGASSLAGTGGDLPPPKPPKPQKPPKPAHLMQGENAAAAAAGGVGGASRSGVATAGTKDDEGNVVPPPPAGKPKKEKKPERSAAAAGGGERAPSGTPPEKMRFTLYAHNLTYGAVLLLITTGLLSFGWNVSFANPNIFYSIPIDGSTQTTTGSAVITTSWFASVYSIAIGIILYAVEYKWGLVRSPAPSGIPVKGILLIALSIPLFLSLPLIMAAVALIIAGMVNIIADAAGETGDVRYIKGSYIMWFENDQEKKGKGKKKNACMEILKDYGRLGQIVFASTYVLINLILAIDQYIRWSALVNACLANPRNTLCASQWAPFAKVFGQLLNFNCALVLIPVIRGIIRFLNDTEICAKTTLASFIPLRKNIIFHKFVAGAIAIATAGHVYIHYINFALAPVATLNAFGAAPWFTGPLIVIAMIVIYSGAQNRVKRAHYEIFFTSHHAFVLFFAMLLCHGPHFWYWSCLPVLLYVLERVNRLKRGNKPFFVRTVRFLPPVMELEFCPKSKDDFIFREGMYLYLACPYISANEWHPFTISSAHCDLLKDDIVSCHIRVQADGSWTHRLKTYFSMMAKPSLIGKDGRFEINLQRYDNKAQVQIGKQNGPDGTQLLMVDGPHAAPAQHYSEYTDAMVIGAGIGLTPLASIIKAVLRQKWKLGFDPKTVHFYWVVRQSEVDSFTWFVKLLHELECRLASDRLTGAITDEHHIDINIYVSSAPKEKTPVRAELYANSSQGGGAELGPGYDVSVGFSAKDLHYAILNPTIDGKRQREVQDYSQRPENRFMDIWIWGGRPEWGDIFQKVKQDRDPTTRQICVAFCGTPIIGKDLKTHCRNSSEPGKVAFVLHKENF